MTKLRTLLNTWYYLGYDKDTLKKYEIQVAKDNIRTFSITLPFAAFITLAELIFVYLFAISGDGITESLYITINFLIITVVLIAMLSVFYLLVRRKKNVVRYSRILTTTLLGSWSLLYIILGTCIDTEDYAVLACGMFLLVQVMFNTYPKDNLLFVGCDFILFASLCFMNKTADVFIYDILDSFPFLIVGLFLSWTKSRSKWASLINADAMVQLKTQQLENDLLQSRVAVMLSQIQPHFLYNSLTVVQALCRTDPELAERVTLEFSNYLRGNLDSLNAKNPVQFNKELEHTKIFLKLEKLQYGEKLRIIYDIKADSFVIPALTIQSIVENSVKYGFKKKEHITVKISSYEDERSYYVIIEDDGPGFDPNEPLDTARSHVGINNVRKRLKLQTGSSLNIQSEIGTGTKVTVTVPKERSEI